MGDNPSKEPISPHTKRRRIILFPLPFQGHINPMIQLANILHSRGFTISIIHTQFNSPDPSKYPYLTFHLILDGLSEDQESKVDILRLLHLLNTDYIGPFRECLGKLWSTHEDIACIITDALMYCTKDVVENLRIPRIVLRTTSVCSFIAFVTFPVLQEKEYSYNLASSSLLTQDRSVISWLDTQKPNSVLYVSFGSLVSLDEKNLTEVAWGLANSMQSFLWVVRPGLVQGSSEWLESLPNEFFEVTDKRGYIVKWAPQQEVLSHPTVGGFLTHSGWNSVLESICEGVPMICSSFLGDQMVNSRYINDVWKLGIKLECGLKREEIDSAIRKIMLGREGQEIRDRLLFMKEKIDVSLKTDGFSSQYLNALSDLISSFKSTGL